MKAKIIETGEEITIIGISKEWGTAQYYGSDGILHIRSFRDQEIKIIDDTPPINWEQRRYEIAKDVLCSMEGVIYGVEVGLDVRTRYSIATADALIAELKGEKK